MNYFCCLCYLYILLVLYAVNVLLDVSSDRFFAMLRMTENFNRFDTYFRLFNLFPILSQFF